MGKKILVIFLLFLDQSTKYLTLDVHKEITPFFAITSTSNTGTIFGLFKGSNIFFIILTLFLILLVLYFYQKEKHLQTGFLFILAGAFGNLLDRLVHGHVLDFLDFKIWPIFNLADAFITFGILYCIYTLIKDGAEIYYV